MSSQAQDRTQHRTHDQQTPARGTAPAKAPTARALLASCAAARTVSTPPDRVNPESVADENEPARGTGPSGD